MRKYPTNREFIKTLRHNKKNYTLRSIFDTDNQYDFDRSIARFNRANNTYSFDQSIQRAYNDRLNLHDSLDDLIRSYF